MPELLEPAMSKKKGGEGGEGGDVQPAAKPGKNPANTKVDAELLRQARLIAAYEDKDLYEVLDAFLRPAITERYRQIVPGPQKEDD